MSEKVRIEETLVKYLAGLLDADGSLSLGYKCDHNKPGSHYVTLNLSLASSDVVDVHRFIDSLPEKTGMGSICRYGSKNQYKSFRIAKTAHLEMILPRIIKHMVIKGKHWQYLLNYWRENRGRCFTEAEAENAKLSSRASRVSNVGPLKPKKHPTWAWVAGYLDGDGYYSCNKAKCGVYKGKQYYHTVMKTGAVSHKNDRVALDLLNKAFGGKIMEHGQSKNCLNWYRSLGPKDKSFAEKFLGKLVNHAHLKRHKIQKLLSIHKQRLNEQTPAGEAIV